MILRKMISAILCIAYFNSTIARADQIDDLEKYVNESIESYRKEIEGALALEKTLTAPTHVTNGISIALGLTNNAMNSHIDTIHKDISALVQESQILNSHQNSIRSAAATVSIESYQNLLSKKYEAELSISRMRALYSDIQNRTEVLKEITKGKDNLCEKLSKKLDANHKALESASVIVNKIDLPGYKGIDPRAFYDQSPIARGVALLGGSIAFVAGVYLYAHAKGTTILYAAKTLFNIQATTNGVLLGGTGWGAVIIIAAVATAYIAGTAYAEHQNAENEKRRDKALKRLLTEIENIQNQYNQRKMTTEQFQSLGLELCKLEELEKNADGRTGLIFSTKKAWSKIIDEIDEASKGLSELKGDMDTTSNNLKKIAQQTEDNLKIHVSSEIINNLNNQSLSQEQLANGWLLYNESVKPIWNRFSLFHIANMNDCMALRIEQELYKAELDAASSLIESEVEGLGGMSSELLNQLESSQQLVVNSMQERLKACP